MFEFIRTHQRLMQFMLMLIIFPSFAFFGLDSYTRLNDSGNAVAKVAGQSVTQQEWDAAQREQMENMRQRFGAQFDSRMFDTPEAKQNVLDNLVGQRVLAATAARENLSVTDQALQQSILALPGLTTPEGKFDVERYKSLLAAQGMTPAMFEARLRQDMVSQQINTAIQATAFAPKSVANRLSDLNDQEREVQEITFKTAEFVPQVKVTDEMLKTYYGQNSRQFEVAEQVKAEYVILNADALADQIAVTDDDIEKQYQANIKAYTVEEQRRASHVLVALKKDASAADKAAAKTKAEKLLEQIRKNPADFAKIAKANSDDPGSAERGGDLDFFSKGMMVKPFEENAYKLKEGEISDLVLSDFGYHIIQVTGIKPPSVKPLAEVKAEIAAGIKKQQAAKKYSEMAEVFTNTIYEQSDSLKAVAEKLKLKIETVADLTRSPNPAMSPKAPYNNPKFLKALFADDAIKNKRNTEAVEVAPSTLIAGRVAVYKPATKRPFEEVQAMVKDIVTQEEAKKRAKAAGEAKIAALKAKDDASGFAAPKTVSRTKQGVERNALVAVMKADATKLPAFVGVDGPDGYSVYRLNKVQQASTPDKARRDAEQQQVANALAQQEMVAYVDLLKQKAKVQILKPVSAVTADAKTQAGGDTVK